jgi:hypothetical protein
MSGVIAGLVGSLKAVVAALTNKFFELRPVATTSYQGELSRDIVTDSLENVYFSNGSYIYKYAKDGSFVWAKSYGGDTNKGTTLAIDSSNIYVSSTDATSMAVLVALDISTGNVVWSKRTTAAPINQTVPAKIVNFSSTQLAFGTMHYASNGKDNDIAYPTIINKSDGSMAYNGSAGFSVISCMSVDNSGNLWICTTGNGTFKINTSLTLSNCYIQGSFTYIDSLKFDSSGNIYLTLSSNYVSKYNSSLVQQWQKSIAVPAASPWYSSNNNIMDIDSSGNVYFIPGFERQQYGTTYKSPVIKFNSSGTVLWTKMLTAGTFTFNSFVSALRVTSSGYLLTSISSNSTVSKLKADGVSWGPVTSSSGTSLSWQDYASATVSSTSISAFISSSTTYGTFVTGSTFGWSTYTFSQTSSTTALTDYYTYL